MVLIGELVDESIESSIVLQLTVALGVGLIFGWDHADIVLEQDLHLLAGGAVVLGTDAFEGSVGAGRTVIRPRLHFVDHKLL